MKRLSFKDRLQLVSAGIDFLLNHPGLKFSDILLGLMVLRHTVLFGKLSDAMTRRQQRQGVGQVNRGTGRSVRRLRRASTVLVEVGFIQTSKAEGHWRGLTHTLCPQTILEYAKKLRASAAPQKATTPAAGKRGRGAVEPGSGRDRSVLDSPQAANSSPGGRPWREAGDIDRLQSLLADLAAQLGSHLQAPSQRTCSNLLSAARSSRPDAAPEEVAWFIREKLVGGRPDRFSSWGGVYTAVMGDFGQSAPSIRREPQVGLQVNGRQPVATREYLKAQLTRCLSTLDRGEVSARNRRALEEHVATLERELAASGDIG